MSTGHETLLEEVSEVVASRLGLHFPATRTVDLERGLSGAARELGYRDAEECARAVLAGPLTRRETEVLASHLTVGETYFFREPETLAVFESHIIPELVRARGAGDRTIRIWSAGCCTGEEPYTIAMILDQLVPDVAEWNVTILATDINPRFLRNAAEGVYREWSFRAMRPGTRERYFRRRRDGRWELDPEIRRRVKFEYLNLAEDLYPSLFNDTNAMDVIFCRNVLMYFSEERARAVAEGFRNALLPGGWMIVSATEASGPAFASYEAVRFERGTVYRKPAGKQVPPLPAESRAPAPAPPAAAASRRASVSAGRKARPAGRREDAIDKARQCANDGRLAEAATWCMRAIDSDKLNPGHHYLLAMIQREMGDDDAAAVSLRRAIYLDPEFTLAHFGLAHLAISRGAGAEAQRHLANALSGLDGKQPDEILEEAEGLTAGRLREIISSLADSLPDGGGR